jgi:hypothetical protein
MPGVDVSLILPTRNQLGAPGWETASPGVPVEVVVSRHKRSTQTVCVWTWIQVCNATDWLLGFQRGKVIVMDCLALLCRSVGWQLEGHSWGPQLLGLLIISLRDRRGHWNFFFSIYVILPAALGLAVYSASNRNEYQKEKNNVSGE